MTTNVQSVVSPAKPNGKGKGLGKVKAAAKSTTTLASAATGILTEAQALKIGFEYGKSMAGKDGVLTNVLKQHNSKVFIRKLINEIAAGYYCDKLDYDEDKARATTELSKHNPDIEQDAKHRTHEEENIHTSVRMLVSRAKKLAGVVDEEQAARQDKANATKAENAKVAAAVEAKRQEAWEIVHPPVTEDFDINAALSNLVARIRSLMNEHSARIVGDTGSKWREWLAKAPKIAK